MVIVLFDVHSVILNLWPIDSPSRVASKRLINFTRDIALTVIHELNQQSLYSFLHTNQSAYTKFPHPDVEDEEVPPFGLIQVSRRKRCFARMVDRWRPNSRARKRRGKLNKKGLRRRRSSGFVVVCVSDLVPFRSSVCVSFFSDFGRNLGSHRAIENLCRTFRGTYWAFFPDTTRRRPRSLARGHRCRDNVGATRRRSGEGGN